MRAWLKEWKLLAKLFLVVGIPLLVILALQLVQSLAYLKFLLS